MSKGVSLHLGLNSVNPQHYAGWSGKLNACEADAEDMQDIAKKAGFTAKLFKTKQATRLAVTKGIKAAATALKKGDLFFLSYSGHGGQVPDKDNEEPDLKDETWCLFDGELIDDELYELYAKFAPGVRVVVLSDSCHSGTVTKMAFDAFASGALSGGRLAESLGVDAPRYRFMPDDVAFRTYRQNQRFYDKLQAGLPKGKTTVKCTVRLISGCQDNQLSLDGTFNGLFTGMLLRVWNNAQFAGDYPGFHKAIVKQMPPTQTPNHFIIGEPNANFAKQKPFTI
jgi:hypothetical protein